MNRQDFKKDTKSIALYRDGQIVEVYLNPYILEISAKNADTIKLEGQNQSSFVPASNEVVLIKGVRYTDEEYMEYPELL